jgi:hypothetical protein
MRGRPPLISLVHLEVDELVKWYQDNDIPEVFRAQHPIVLEAIAEICGNDWRRCVLELDGSVVIYNRQMW